MTFKPLLIFLLLLHSCNNAATYPVKIAAAPLPGKNQYGNINSIPLPAGYTRVTADSNSFAGWLRKIILKEDKTVHLFNGALKQNQLAQFAVMDISVGNKDLQQCADAVMRLRAEYLFGIKRYGDIIFYDNNHTAYAFAPPYTREHFTHYLQQVFGMCGSASLSKQLKPVTDFNGIQPGDVIIRGGFPGHAVLVTDVAVNSGGEKIYMLSQGYMPAQDIHVLVNPADEKLSPWYEVNNNATIITPEYIFNRNELRKW